MKTVPVTTNLDANWGQDDNVPDRMSGVLKQLSEADADYDFRSMWGAWGRWGALSPKQAGAMIAEAIRKRPKRERNANE